MKQVFVSYTQSDRDVAFELVNHLEERGISCFIAPRDVDGGKAYASIIMKAIDDCSIVLLVASEAINHSEHVLNEVDVVIEKGKTLLPVFVEDFKMNDDYRYYLGRKQWIIAYPDNLQTYYNKISDTVMENIPVDLKPGQPASDRKSNDDSKQTTVFDYYPDRGIMINPEDHQRNVSFRTDTFVNMMGGIYEKVEGLVGNEEAINIFYNSGYTSGKNFAERLDNQWDTGCSFEDMKNKVEKWCRFDSAVGWGRFSSELSIDEENDSLNGKIYISEAFIVDNKKKREICAFIRGYCTGVLEILLNSTEVELICSECPMKSKFKTQCVFDIKVK